MKKKNLVESRRERSDAANTYFPRTRPLFLLAAYTENVVGDEKEIKGIVGDVERNWYEASFVDIIQPQPGS